jgi:hypothetical protein
MTLWQCTEDKHATKLTNKQYYQFDSSYLQDLYVMIIYSPIILWWFLPPSITCAVCQDCGTNSIINNISLHSDNCCYLINESMSAIHVSEAPSNLCIQISLVLCSVHVCVETWLTLPWVDKNVVLGQGSTL